MANGVANTIVSQIAGILSRDQGTVEWGGSGLSTQMTKTELSGAVGGTTYKTILGGDTGAILFPYERDKTVLFFSMAILGLYLIGR